MWHGHGGLVPCPVVPDAPTDPRRAGDADDAEEPTDDLEAPDGRRSVASRKRRRAGGTGVMAAAMLGLRDVFEEPRDEEIAVVVDDDQLHHDGDGMSVHLDPDSPPQSRVQVHGPDGAGPTPAP